VIWGEPDVKLIPGTGVMVMLFTSEIGQNWTFKNSLLMRPRGQLTGNDRFVDEIEKMIGCCITH